MRLQLEGSGFQSILDLGNILVHEWTSLSCTVKTKLNTVASYVCKHALLSWKPLLTNNLKKITFSHPSNSNFNNDGFLN